MARKDYSPAQKSAERMIERYGADATLLRPTASGPAYNPTPGAPVSLPVVAVTSTYGLREIDGTRILATDRRVLLAGRNLAIEPATSDRLKVGATEYAIVDVRVVKPGATVIYYELQVRA